MKFRFFVLSLISMITSIGCLGGAEKPREAQSKKSVFDFSFTSIDGKIIKLDSFRGKKILIVNVASKCGFTPQYEDLEKLHRLKKEELTVIGFPANNFMGQEPGTNEQIAEFCKSNYDVTFLLSEKISVIGDDQNEIYKWLTDKSFNGWNDLAPKWNFYKYLINESGELIRVFPSATKPMSEELLSLI